MAGFLEKDKRLIDYKLTEFGRDKMSLGTFDLKYYTFSDSSIVYQENTNSQKSFKVSDLSSYLAFEVDTSVNNVLNPEFRLSSEITFDQIESNILFLNKETNSTLSDYLIDLKYLDNKELISENDNREISFDYEFERDEFNFNNNTFSYCTIKDLSINLSNIDYISNDKRFINKTRNLFLPPENSSKNIERKSYTIPDEKSIEFIFKSLNIEPELPSYSNREDYIVNIINQLNKSDKIFKLEYILNEEKMLDEDVFLFELHKINNNKLEKLSFINLGEFYDKKDYNFKNIFLIGKVFLTRNIKENINDENRRYYFKINNDYSFVNMFTLVVE